MKEIYRIDKNVQTRWANAENPKGEKGGAAKALNGRKGAASLYNFRPGETRVLAEVTGSGIIRHIWITTENRNNAKTLKGYRLDFYWDGAGKPAVSVPLGDFFCFNSGRLSPMESEFFSNPEGRSFNCWIPMPFKMGMKVTVTNETQDITEGMFFYQIDYTVGDDVADALYFHGFYNREAGTVSKRDYVILPQLEGCGRYLGASFGVIANPLLGCTWWGEGEVKCYIDGDGEYPTLAGTGTEDYIGTGWGQGRYANRYQGCVHADGDAMRYSFYRFHVRDVVNFTRDIKITIQQIGYSSKEEMSAMLDRGIELYKMDGGKMDPDFEGGLFERVDDDWCSVAYFYYDRPTSALPALPPYEERVAKYTE